MRNNSYQYYDMLLKASGQTGSVQSTGSIPVTSNDPDTNPVYNRQQQQQAYNQNGQNTPVVPTATPKPKVVPKATATPTATVQNPPPAKEETSFNFKDTLQNVLDYLAKSQWSRAGVGAGVGGLLGAGVGGMFGNAGVGSLVGTLGGGAFGYLMDPKWLEKIPMGDGTKFKPTPEPDKSKEEALAKKSSLENCIIALQLSEMRKQANAYYYNY